MGALRCLAIAQALSLCPAAAFAGPAEGHHRIELRVPVVQQYAIIGACESIGTVQICYSFFPRVDLRGRLETQGTAKVTGQIDGLPVSGELPIEVTGAMKGAAGDGVEPHSKWKLAMRARDAELDVAGESLRASLSVSLRGNLVHASPAVEMLGKRKLDVKGLGKSSGAVTLSLQNPAPRDTVRLQLALDPPDGTKLAGTAELSVTSRATQTFAVRGSYSGRRDSSSLSFKSAAKLRGTSLKVTRLDLSGAQPMFELRYELAGIRGKVSSTGADASWHVLASDFESEGSPIAPLEVTSLLPYAGSVGALEQSYYLIRGLEPNHAYTLELERIEALTDLDARPGGASCGWASDDPLAVAECPALSDSTGELRFVVARHGGNDAGGTFRLSLRDGAVLDEGRPDAPVELTRPYRGHAALQSFYRIGGLEAGATYTLSFANATTNVGFFIETVFFDGSTWVCNAKRSGDTCEFTAPAAGEILVQSAVQSGAPGGEYDLALTTGGAPNQGSRAAPLDLTGALPYAGTVFDNLGSYYRVTGLVPGAPYTATLQGIDRGVSLSMFGSGWHGLYLRPNCQTDTSQTTLGCVGQADTSGELFFRILRDASSSGAHYTLALGPGGLPNEGVFDLPLDVTGQLPRLSSVYNAASYYVAHGLGSRPVTVSVTPSGVPRMILYLSVESSTGEELCSANGEAPACTATPEAGALRIRVMGAGSGMPLAFILDAD